MLFLTVFQNKISEFFYSLDQEFELRALLEFIRDVVFDVRLGEYKNFSIGNMTADRLATIVFAATVAIILCSVLLSNVRSNQGRFVRALLNKGATTKESAKTLYELGFFRDQSIRKSLSSGNELHLAVKCVEEEAFLADSAVKGSENDRISEEFAAKKGRGFLPKLFSGKKRANSPEFRLDFTRAHFYIPEELKYVAENRFSLKGFGKGKLWLVAIATVVLAVVFCRAVDPVLTLADNLLTLVKGI